MEKMLNSYIETALWSSVNEDGTPLDRDHEAGDISQECLDQMRTDCEKFQDQNADLISRAIEDGADIEQIGHDFWLTRNHHGAGFWDGDYEKKLGESLTKAADKFGEINLEVGDDKKIHAL